MFYCYSFCSTLLLYYVPVLRSAAVLFCRGLTWAVGCSGLCAGAGTRGLAAAHPDPQDAGVHTAAHSGGAVVRLLIFFDFWCGFLHGLKFSAHVMCILILDCGVLSSPCPFFPHPLTTAITCAALQEHSQRGVLKRDHPGPQRGRLVQPGRHPRVRLP